MKKLKVRHPFERERSQVDCGGESRTQQSHKDSVDVNKIIARFDRTGQLPPARSDGQYGDVSGLNAYFGDVLIKSQQDIETAQAFLDARKAQIESQSSLAAEKEEAPPGASDKEPQQSSAD